MTITAQHHETELPSTRRRVAVVSASVRKDRLSPTIADWVTSALDDDGRSDVDLIDLADTVLPDDSELYPGGGPSTGVAERIAAADAFVFVTPEYNRSFPASLKRLIDWHYAEWKLKPATVVAYGVHGGHAAIDHLRGVLGELHVVTTRRAAGLRAPWESLDDAERFVPDARTARELTGALAELGWWTDVLADARATGTFPG
ncbi:NADPH-dependent FMN reductase [Isoptericola croceus]|uniref:NADPH-dependent FMN reductase n=1 Tax=Isoptericola croceus TaxID=3031406 RepID=UPI0023F687EA|nr:NAD(P)H-dependent oxidoreductase [Isoptericola croceus]